MRIANKRDPNKRDTLAAFEAKGTLLTKPPQNRLIACAARLVLAVLALMLLSPFTAPAAQAQGGFTLDPLGPGSQTGKYETLEIKVRQTLFGGGDIDINGVYGSGDSVQSIGRAVGNALGLDPNDYTLIDPNLPYSQSVPWEAEDPYEDALSDLTLVLKSHIGTRTSEGVRVQFDSAAISRTVRLYGYQRASLVYCPMGDSADFSKSSKPPKIDEGGCGRWEIAGSGAEPFQMVATEAGDSDGLPRLFLLMAAIAGGTFLLGAVLLLILRALGVLKTIGGASMAWIIVLVFLALFVWAVGASVIAATGVAERIGLGAQHPEAAAIGAAVLPPLLPAFAVSALGFMLALGKPPASKSDRNHGQTDNDGQSNGGGHNASGAIGAQPADGQRDEQPKGSSTTSTMPSWMGDDPTPKNQGGEAGAIKSGQVEPAAPPLAREAQPGQQEQTNTSEQAEASNQSEDDSHKSKPKSSGDDSWLPPS